MSERDSGVISAVREVEEAGRSVASKAPHWAALILVVLAFLFYMERTNTRADLVSQQRISTCHDVQIATNAVLERLSEVLITASEEQSLVRAELERVTRALDHHSRTVERLINLYEKGEDQ